MIDFTRRGSKQRPRYQQRFRQMQQQGAIPGGSRNEPPTKWDPNQPRGPYDPGVRPGTGAGSPQAFGNLYGPQLQQLQQMFPGFMNQAHQQFVNMRDQYGPGFWHQWIDPSQRLQANAPGFLQMFEALMGRPLPPRFMNYGVNRGWFPPA